MGLVDKLKATYNKNQNINNFDNSWTRQFIKNNSEKTAVFFCGWRTDKKLHKKVFKQFPHHNHLIYTLPNSLICSDLKLMEKSWKKIANSIENDIKNFKIEIIYGLSLGTSLALYCANRCKNAKKVFLGFPGDKIAPCVWEGSLTKDIAQQIEQEEKYTYDDYSNFFKPYDHINNLSNLQGAKIKIYLAKSDDAVPYYRGKKLIKKMHSMKLSPTVKKTFLGHALGIIKSIIFTNWLTK